MVIPRPRLKSTTVSTASAFPGQMNNQQSIDEHPMLQCFPSAAKQDSSGIIRK